MISINAKWSTILLVILLYNNPLYAEIEESRITKIIQITKGINKDSSMKEQSEIFVQDLRKKLPHFSEEQLEVMKTAYIDALLYKRTESQVESPDDSKEAAEINSSETKPLPKENSISKNIGKFLGKNKKADSSSDKDTGVLKKEAKQTIVFLTVEKGDTLSDIAKRNYNDASMYIAIYEENKDQLTSPNFVPEGVILKVPTIDSSNKEEIHKMTLKYEKEHKK